MQVWFCPPSPFPIPSLPLILPTGVRPSCPTISNSQPYRYGVRQKRGPCSPKQRGRSPNWYQFSDGVKGNAEADAYGHSPEYLGDRMVGEMIPPVKGQ